MDKSSFGGSCAPPHDDRLRLLGALYRRRRQFAMAVSLVLIGCSTPVFAQNTNAVAQREAARRQAALPRGQEALGRAQAAMAEGNYTVAHEEFRLALNYLPDAVISERSHDAAVQGFCASGMKLAEQKMAEGKYKEAEAICREILSSRYDPNCRPAAEMLARLQEPGTVNRTVGPKFLSKVEEVKRLLNDAEGYYNSGRYDLAFKKYEQVLALDPYNVAARRGEERLNLTKTHYGEEAYNETRSRQLWQVQKGWEEPVKKYGMDGDVPSTSANLSEAQGSARISHKLSTIIIPKIEFREASIREALDFIRQQAAENDLGGEGRRGVDIVFRGPLAATTSTSTTVTSAPAVSVPPLPGETSETKSSAVTTISGNLPNDRITLSLSQIPLGEALRYIADQIGMKMKVEPYAVVILPISAQTEDLITKRYHVPPEFFGGPLDVGYYVGDKQSGSAQGPTGQEITQPLVAEKILDKNKAIVRSASGTGEARTSESLEGTITSRQQLVNDRQLVGRAGAREYLQSLGVNFPTFKKGNYEESASATYLPQSGVLIVRNTRDNLDMVDALVEQANLSKPKQVEIEAKFVEITQTNLKELGFDWLLGQFRFGGDRQLAGRGGTAGTGVPVGQSNFPFPIDNLNPLTSGNRSGEFAISGTAIDSLLQGVGPQSLAPGVFGIGGLLTNPQFQVVMRALNQKKGVDLLSAPRVTTKSGQRAIIEIVREFRYPTEFTPPDVPDISGRGSSNSTTTTISLPVVGPSTPKSFATRNTGVILETEPVVGTDGITIDLNLVPQVTEFEGFINYGSPIKTVNPALLGFLGLPTGILANESITLTDNVINQPIFSTRKVTTSVSVWDGQTVVLGGLMREDVQKTEDRTPILGDIPIVGRLFRTNAEQHIKRNLIIFVTARILNPAGQVVTAEEAEESEDVIEPPILPEVPLYKK